MSSHQGVRQQRGALLQQHLRGVHLLRRLQQGALLQQHLLGVHLPRHLQQGTLLQQGLLLWPEPLSWREPLWSRERRKSRAAQQSASELWLRPAWCCRWECSLPEWGRLRWCWAPLLWRCRFLRCPRGLECPLGYRSAAQNTDLVKMCCSSGHLNEQSQTCLPLLFSIPYYRCRLLQAIFRLLACKTTTCA